MARPLLGAALAALAGGGLGALGPGAAPLWPALLAAGVGAWIGFARCRGSVPFACGLLALFGAAGWRAAATAPRGDATAGRVVEGVWAPARGGSLGQLTGAPRGTPWLELDGPGARAGERVRIRPLDAPIPMPAGPVPRAGARTRAVLPVRADQLERLAPAAGHPLLLQRVRAQLGERADGLPTASARGLARALVCGDPAGLDPELADLFARTGTRHLLAVSGTHVALIALMLGLPLAVLGRRVRPSLLRWGALPAALALAVYAVLAGGAPPVRRAALALALARLAALVPASHADGPGGRRPDALSLWSLALLIECTADPRAPAGVGVMLSYLATLGLILGARRTSETLARAAGRGSRPAPRTSGPPAGPARVALDRATHLAAVTVGASLAAVAATLPVAWTVFGETCPSGVVATALALPVVAWLMLAGWGSLLLGPGAADVLFALPAGWLVSFLEVWDALPGTPLALPLRPWPALAVAGGATLGALAGTPGLARAAALAWALVLVPWSPAPAGLELVVLDVGHGTAAVVRAPGLAGLVFDAGSRDRSRVGREALGPLLAAWEVRDPVVVLSHTDRDHASALPWLLERRPPAAFAGALPAPLRERLAHTTPRVDVPGGPASIPLTLGGTARGRLLRGAAGGGNEGSRALVIDLGGARIVLLGDAEAEGLGALLRAGALQGPCDVLLAPHHGSETPWLVPLLEALEPREVWISSPAVPPIARELDRRGVPWRCTGQAGPLTFTAPWHGVRDTDAQ